ncbi:MAG: hypothetical protein ACRCUP_01370 [Mycoplasmatales bacterium]
MKKKYLIIIIICLFIIFYTIDNYRQSNFTWTSNVYVLAKNNQDEKYIFALKKEKFRKIQVEQKTEYINFQRGIITLYDKDKKTIISYSDNKETTENLPFSSTVITEEKDYYRAVTLNDGVEKFVDILKKDLNKEYIILDINW